MPPALRHEIGDDGVSFQFLDRGFLRSKSLSPEQLPAITGPLQPAVRFLLSSLEQGGARVLDTRILLSHGSAAAMPASIASALSLPPLAALSLNVTFEGRIEQPEGRLRLRWQDPNFRTISPERIGAFLKWGDFWGRLSSPIFALVEAAEAFNASVGQPTENRIAHWMPVQSALRAATGQEVSSDNYTGSLTLYQAGSFALDVQETSDGPDFTPVLMSRSKAIPTEESEWDETDHTVGPLTGVQVRDQFQDALLPPDLQQLFVERRMEASPHSRDAYVLGRNTYLLLDPDLKTALDVVRSKRRESAEARRGFIRNPRPAIIEALDREGADDLAGSLFIETSQYSERVDGLGVWEKPVIPWLVREAQQWLPESFSVRIGQRTVELTRPDIEDLKADLKEARDAGATSIDVKGWAAPVSDVEAALAPYATEAGIAVEQDKVEPAYPETRGPIPENLVLKIKDNIHAVEYAFSNRRRDSAISLDFPRHLISRTTPKLHQEAGFDWLVKSWCCGWPGVLLADDMGLGKTFQALSFLAWLKTNLAASGQAGADASSPILVVAPTALLRTWIAEAERHLGVDVLGERVDAFGTGLASLKQRKGPNWTSEEALDIRRMRNADWILTTYETLANYHRAFGRIGYSAVVFDEMQKVKEPGTINTHAAKTINAGFVIGMTGTPIENRLEDIWCIMDRVAPGYLGDLKSFSARHKEGENGALRQLKGQLDQPHGNATAVMLRRMKEDILEGLPEKRVLPYRVEMPLVQSEAYSAAVASAKTNARSAGSMLQTIHILRGISLHPEGAEERDVSTPELARAWISRSARAGKSMEILQEIANEGRKALVFIEDLKMQKAFAEAAAALFSLPRIPSIINGNVPGEKRQAIVDRFQSRPEGFDLLVLSPKAAGIGLTITAANHVIHLSRWWNPAVEDQCNDRVYRIGQTRPVTIHIPIAIHPEYGDRSFDVNLDKLLEVKRSLSRDMLTPPVSDGDIGQLYGESII